MGPGWGGKRPPLQSPRRLRSRPFPRGRRRPRPRPEPEPGWPGPPPYSPRSSQRPRRGRPRRPRAMSAAESARRASSRGLSPPGGAPGAGAGAERAGGRRRQCGPQGPKGRADSGGAGLASTCQRGAGAEAEPARRPGPRRVALRARSERGAGILPGRAHTRAPGNAPEVFDRQTLV